VSDRIEALIELLQEIGYSGPVDAETLESILMLFDAERVAEAMDRDPELDLEQPLPADAFTDDDLDRMLARVARPFEPDYDPETSERGKRRKRGKVDRS